MRKQRSRLCPVCGERITVLGRAGNKGRLYGSCGDAFWASVDSLGRLTIANHGPKTYGSDGEMCVTVVQGQSILDWLGQHGCS